jgi:hypothetical protein
MIANKSALVTFSQENFPANPQSLFGLGTSDDIDVNLKPVHLVSPSGGVDSQVSIRCVARCKTSDPVGAGTIRSAAGAGIRGVTTVGAEQPVKASASASQITLRSFARQHCASVLGICTISFLLHAALDGGLLFLDAGTLVRDAGQVLAVAVPTHAQQHRHQDPGTNQVRRGGS